MGTSSSTQRGRTWICGTSGAGSLLGGAGDGTDRTASASASADAVSPDSRLSKSASSFTRGKLERKKAFVEDDATFQKWKRSRSNPWAASYGDSGSSESDLRRREHLAKSFSSVISHGRRDSLFVEDDSDETRIMRSHTAGELPRPTRNVTASDPDWIRRLAEGKEESSLHRPYAIQDASIKDPMLVPSFTTDATRRGTTGVFVCKEYCPIAEVSAFQLSAPLTMSDPNGSDHGDVHGEPGDWLVVGSAAPTVLDAATFAATHESIPGDRSSSSTYRINKTVWARLMHAPFIIPARATLRNASKKNKNNKNNANNANKTTSKRENGEPFRVDSACVAVGDSLHPYYNRTDGCTGDYLLCDPDNSSDRWILSAVEFNAK